MDVSQLFRNSSVGAAYIITVRLFIRPLLYKSLQLGFAHTGSTNDSTTYIFAFTANSARL